MSKGQALRVLVKKRLTAAAEDIFALFERTIVEYEEELCRSKEENERQQQLLDSVLSPRVLLHRVEDVQNDSCSHGLSLNQDIISQSKDEPEELSIKQEEEELPEYTVVYVKSEEQFSPLEQRQTEHGEETQGEDCGRGEKDSSLDPHGQIHSDETDEQTDNDEDWDPPACSSTQQMEVEAHGDDYNQDQIKYRRTATQRVFTKYKTEPETSDTVKKSDVSGTNVGADGKKHKSSFGKKRFKANYKLVVHTRIHTGEKPNSCPICKKSFVQKGYLKEHIRRIHTEKVYNCPECKKYFAYKSVLKFHMRTHTVKKHFSCSICMNKYTRITNLKHHMRTHSGEKPFSCSVCEKIFTHKRNLEEHKRIHSGEKPYSCSVCEKSFTKKGTLNQHMSTHTGEKPYSCSVCMKKFTQKGNLKHHMRTHSGEKPFSCSVCKKIFTLKSHLKGHMHIHSGEKPYSCSVCEKSFAQKFTLNQHMRTHTGEKPHSCSVCKKTFSQKGHLRRHEDSHKSETTVVESSQDMQMSSLK